MKLLSELPLFEKRIILRKSKAFKKYAPTYEVEVIDSKNPSTQLTITRSGGKELSNDSLFEMKTLKYQKLVVTNFVKNKENDEIEYVNVYFGSNAMTIINDEDIEITLDHYFQVNFNKIDNGISAVYDWVIEFVDDTYFNISVYNPLSESSYRTLPKEFKKLKRRFGKY